MRGFVFWFLVIIGAIDILLGLTQLSTDFESSMFSMIMGTLALVAAYLSKRFPSL